MYLWPTMTWQSWLQQPMAASAAVLIWSGGLVWNRKLHLNGQGSVWFEKLTLDTPTLLLHVSVFTNYLASFSQTAHFVHCCLKKDKMLCLYIS